MAERIGAGHFFLVLRKAMLIPFSASSIGIGIRKSGDPAGGGEYGGLWWSCLGARVGGWAGT
jgi:hypothetical protein